MAEYLIQIGIDSMRLNPDAVLKTTLCVLEIENNPYHKLLNHKPVREQAINKTQASSEKRRLTSKY